VAKACAPANETAMFSWAGINPRTLFASIDGGACMSSGFFEELQALRAHCKVAAAGRGSGLCLSSETLIEKARIIISPLPVMLLPCGGVGVPQGVGVGVSLTLQVHDVAAHSQLAWLECSRQQQSRWPRCLDRDGAALRQARGGHGGRGGRDAGGCSQWSRTESVALRTVSCVHRFESRHQKPAKSQPKAR
jgi:hypothetical protein